MNLHKWLATVVRPFGPRRIAALKAWDAEWEYDRPQSSRPVGCRFDFETVFDDGTTHIRRHVDVCAVERYIRSPLDSPAGQCRGFGPWCRSSGIVRSTSPSPPFRRAILQQSWFHGVFEPPDRNTTRYSSCNATWPRNQGRRSVASRISDATFGAEPGPTIHAPGVKPQVTEGNLPRYAAVGRLRMKLAPEP